MSDEEAKQLKDQVARLQQQVAHLTDVYFRTHFVDKDVFTNPVYLPEKTAFFGSQTLVSKQAAITAPTGGTTVDSEARTAINTIRTRLQSLGLTL